jgi:hypothetical protein
MEVTAQKTELFIRSVCVLHNFIIKEKGNGEERLSQCTAEAMTEDHNNYMCNVANRPTTCAPDVRHTSDNYLVPLSGHFSNRITTCSKTTLVLPL